jgi:hypothetical protein
VGKEVFWNEKVFCLGSFSVVSKDGVPFPDPFGGQKEFGGKFALRIDPALHRRLAAKRSLPEKA